MNKPQHSDQPTPMTTQMKPKKIETLVWLRKRKRSTLMIMKITYLRVDRLSKANLAGISSQIEALSKRRAMPETEE